MKRAAGMFLLGLLVLTRAVAQTPQGPPPRPEIPPAQNQFVPQSEAPKQPEVAAAPLVYVAYAFVWAVLLLYVFVLWRRIGRVERELAEVHRKLKT